MENLSRKLEQSQRVAPGPTPSLWRLDRGWTLVLVGDHGKVHFLRSQRIWLATCSGLIIAALLGGIVGFSGAWLLRHGTGGGAALPPDAQQQLLRLREEKDALLARAVLAESELQRHAPGQSAVGSAPAAATAAASPAVSAPAPPPAEAQSATVARVVAAPEVSIESFSAKRGDAGRISLRFRLLNSIDADPPLTGTYFVILAADGMETSRWAVFPAAPLSAGKPADPRQGRSFNLKRFTTMRFDQRVEGNPNAYSLAVILVYGDAGQLLVERSFSF